MLYLISYDLKNSTKDYSSLYEAIKSYGQWWHYMDSTWIVSTQSQIETVVQSIRSQIEEADNLFVVEISGCRRNGWLPKKAWDWLRAHDVMTRTNTDNTSES